MIVDLRPAICGWARWGVAHEPQIHWSEGFDRIDWVGRSVGFLPIHPDCASFQIMIREWAGAPRPDGQPHLSRLVGDTQTIMQHCEQIALSQAGAADMVLYGTGALSTQHVSCLLESGSNPMTVSHGREAGPLYQRVFDDARPKRYFRSVTSITVPDPKPLPAPKGHPTQKDLDNRGVVGLPNPKAAQLAVKNGWPLFYFVQGHVPEFVAQVGGNPKGTTLYAWHAYRTKRPAAA